MNAKEYWEQIGVRLLGENGCVPTLEERVQAAFIAGKTEAYNSFLRLERELEQSRMDNFFKKHLKSNQ